MAWIETLTKETFNAAIREAMKPQIDQLSDRLQTVENNVVDLRERVSRLEGTIEGTAKANEAKMDAYDAGIRNLILEFKNEILQRQLDIVTSSK